MATNNVIKQIRQLGERIIPAGGNLWLYGSRARGDYRSDSDWDLLVLVDKDKIQWADYDNYAYPFTELGWNIGQTINPVLYSKQEWEARNFSPFYHNVQNDKKVILWVSPLKKEMESLRTKADYDVVYDVSKEDLTEMQPMARELVELIIKMLS